MSIHASPRLQLASALTIVSIALSPAAHAQFGPEQVVHTTAAPGFLSTVTAADLDGDGDIDLASAFIGPEGIGWYPNDGTGTFGPVQTIDASLSETRLVRAGDVDGDGDQDLFVATDSVDSIVMYENHGGAVFGPRQLLDSRIDNVTEIALVDDDGDGDLDIVASYFCIDLIVRMENLGGVTFAPAVPLLPGGFSVIYDIDYADLDGDGDPDLLAAVDTFTATFFTVENLGGGAYATPVEVLLQNSAATDATPADVDGDGDLDLLLATDSAARGYRWQENRGGDFSLSRAIQLGVNSWVIEAVDVDHDGDPDAVCVDEAGDMLSWYENLGGTFGPEQLIDTYGGNVWTVVAADLDADGRTDLATSIAFSGGRVSWYSNETPRFEAYCPQSVANSSGVPARLFASGSDSVSANDVVLEASSLPPLSTAVFLVGRSRGFFPGARGMSGTYCIGGPPGRFLAPGQVRAADAAGDLSLAVDATVLPTSTATAAAQPGETWHFQCWYRDAGAPPGVSRVTNGVSVTFE